MDNKLKQIDEIYLARHKYIEGNYDLIGVDGKRLFLLNVSSELESRNSSFYLYSNELLCTMEGGQTVEEALLAGSYKYSTFSGYQFMKFDVTPGKFHPRIYTPILYFSGNSIVEEDALIDYHKNDTIRDLLSKAVNQVSLLKEMVIALLNNIYPATENFSAYGNVQRNLLVLACIETETQLSGILKANNYKQKSSYSTKDFVKLNNFLKLNRYRVSLPFYPHLEPFRPFDIWNEKNPTQSLEWYDAYNGIKHNGEEEFSRATLLNVLNAVCAVVILLVAQYGYNIPYWNEKVGSFFYVDSYIQYNYTDYLLPPLQGNAWEEKHLFS